MPPTVALLDPLAPTNHELRQYHNWTRIPHQFKHWYELTGSEKRLLGTVAAISPSIRSVVPIENGACGMTAATYAFLYMGLGLIVLK